MRRTPPPSSANRNPDDYEMVGDILDVWFDSGCTHVFTLESGHWPEERWPADLYLEGSDQHRGWFQSSLLESCGTRGRAPYDAVLTHGFTMDAKGMKMSKSLGNTVNPLDLMKDYGADIIRLWALSVDFTEDHRIGKEILAGVGDQYRKLRNTFRYLLGALDGFSEDGAARRRRGISRAGALHAPSDRRARREAAQGGRRLRLQHLRPRADRLLQRGFVAPSSSISARTASIATRPSVRLKRRAYRTVLDTLFHALVRWLAPVLVFTTEEVWGTRYPGRRVGASARMAGDAGGRCATMRNGPSCASCATQVTEAIEPLRRDKVIGSSLEAEVTVPSDEDPELLAELFIISTVRKGDEISGDQDRPITNAGAAGAICPR